jgi:hypothetical protein
VEDHTGRASAPKPLGDPPARAAAGDREVEDEVAAAGVDLVSFPVFVDS